MRSSAAEDSTNLQNNATYSEDTRSSNELTSLQDESAHDSETSKDMRLSTESTKQPAGLRPRLTLASETSEGASPSEESTGLHPTPHYTPEISEGAILFAASTGLHGRPANSVEAKGDMSPSNNDLDPFNRQTSDNEDMSSSENLTGLFERLGLTYDLETKKYTGPADLMKVVLEYLSKKGYSKTEAMLRVETAPQEAEGRPIQPGMEDLTGSKYGSAFMLMREWIEDSCLEIHKPDLRRLQWPIFVYSFFKLVSNFSLRDSRSFFTTFKDAFEAEHRNELRALEPISLPEHLETNDTAKIYRDNKYRLRLSSMAFNNFILFLEGKEKEGTRLMVTIMTQNLQIISFERTAENESSLSKILARAKAPEDFPAEDEGIPGHNPGSANTEQVAGSNVLTRVKLGPMPMEPDLMGDVRGELEDEDVKNPRAEGQSSLVQHFEQQIKREESEDAPARTELPLPQSTARDVAMEVQKVKENRDRFRIEGKTGGVGPGVSVVMFTFHNTYDSITCVDFSQDNRLIAAGTDQSYIRVWTVDGEALPSHGESSDTDCKPSASRRLIGHSGIVNAVSFSPSVTPTNKSLATKSTASKHLLSCSRDKTVRLWSLEQWTCLVVYKGHDDVVWDIRWGPFGHYFATGSHDRTARLWSTSEVSFLRIFVGHDKDVDALCFHPNNAYVFTGSCDKTVRMWKCTDGIPVRMFTGHTGNITAIECSPSGKILASADDNGTIILWDLAPGKLLKRMRGHGKGGIWSLSWSAESTVLISGGMDGTVRVWDVAASNDASGQARVSGEGGAGQKADAGTQAQTSGGGTKKKGKEVVVTSDQISAFPTKKSPIYKVMFTRQNLAMAGGAYMP